MRNSDRGSTRSTSYANVVATLALVLVVGGGSALAVGGHNTIFSDDIAKNQVKSKDLAPGAVRTTDTGPVPAASVFGNGGAPQGQLIPPNQVATVVLDTAAPEFLTGIGTASNALVVKTPGVYALGAHVAWLENPTGSRGASITVNGTAVATDNRTAVPSVTEQGINGLEELDQGDSVGLIVAHDTPGEQVVVNGPGETDLTMHWVGPCDGSCN